MFKQLNGNEDANENPIQLTSIASIEYIPETIEGISVMLATSKLVVFA